MTEEVFEKRVEITTCRYDMQHTRWQYKIYSIADYNTYKAKLFIYDEYDGYLADYKVYKSSPEFKTLEEAENYAIEYWGCK